MAIKRLGHVSVVVDDLAAAFAFFTALGMALEGEFQHVVEEIQVMGSNLVDMVKELIHAELLLRDRFLFARCGVNG